MFYVNLINLFMLGAFSQYALYHFIKDNEYSYEKKYLIPALIVTGVLYPFLWIEFYYSVHFFIYSATVSIIVTSLFTDYQHKIILDEMNLLLLFFGVVNVMINFTNPLTYLTGFMFSGVLFLSIAVITGGLLGGGDIKMIATLGLIVGFESISAIMLMSFLFAGLFSLFAVLIGKLKLSDSIAFGPFIGVSAILQFITHINIF